jgi:hypothetical protein
MQGRPPAFDATGIHLGPGIEDLRKIVQPFRFLARPWSLRRQISRDVVGLYVDPPAHAIVLDEKSHIQALDRRQPGLPLKKGRARTMTHDYGRHGATTLFAAMNVIDGTVIGRNMQRHRHQEVSIRPAAAALLLKRAPRSV